MVSLFNQLTEEWCVILFRCFRCKGHWHVIVVGNWSSNGLIVSALDSSVMLANRRGCSFCNYRLLKGFISHRNLFDFPLRLVVLKRPGFQSQKYGMPIHTSIIEVYAVCFWIRDNQRYSKSRYVSSRAKSMLYCGLSHVQLWNHHCFKKITFLTVYYTG